VAWRYPLDKPEKIGHHKAIDRLKKFGGPLLFFSWLPVVGDPLCFAAGWLRMNPWFSTLFIGAGKAARYAVILFLV